MTTYDASYDVILRHIASYDVIWRHLINLGFSAVDWLSFHLKKCQDEPFNSGSIGGRGGKTSKETTPTPTPSQFLVSRKLYWLIRVRF